MTLSVCVQEKSRHFTARTCNCIIIVLDAIKPITHKRLIEKELEGFGIRLNKEPPNLTFRKKDKGGINLTSTVTATHLDLDTVKAICSEYRMHNADITLRYDATADDLIDVIEGSRIYMPCIYAVNKIDQITLEELEILDKLPHYCPIRGDTAFCSLDCRQQQMAQDEWKEKGKPAKESTVATSGKAGKGGRASTAV